jgi:ribonucleoside-diphosphate reductase alpha chain
LQERGLPFEGLLSQYETRKIFSQIKIESERASMALADAYGEPLWCVGTGMRNTHLRAIAPTVSNSKLSGNVSPGIEPWAANIFTEQSAKGTFIRKNPTLEALLESKNINSKEIWEKILADGGSVQDLKELDNDTKEVFKTFKELNQLELVRQAGIRQQYIDQSVSLNLAFPSEATPKWINKVHMDAWRKGVKTLYYMRTESVLRGDIANTAMDDCVACDG